MTVNPSATAASGPAADALTDEYLADYLAARLCHELVSPIGAIANGVEILEEDGAFAGDAAGLIALSARQATRRLQFYRVAYGSVGPVRTSIARSAAIDLFAEGKVRCLWPEAAIPVDDRLKLACNLILLASETLPRGGEVVLDPAPAVLARGTDIRLSPEAAALLAGEAAEINARTVQAAFTARLARRLGGRIEVRQPEPHSLSFRFV